jgi:hypothetical protein
MEMSFNVNKFKVMHFGRGNPRHDYEIQGRTLSSDSGFGFSDLGVIVSQDLKPSNHVASMAKKAESMSYLIRRHFKYLTVEGYVILYQSLVRPIREY